MQLYEETPNLSAYPTLQNPPKKLLDQVRAAIRLKHYSYRTEETYEPESESKSLRTGKFRG